MTKKLLATLTLLLLFTMTALAAGKGGIVLTSTAEVETIVKNDKGVNEVIRVVAAKANVVPGDTVIFTNHYSNMGEKPGENVVLVNPVPENMVYVADSAEGKGTIIDFSIDRGKSYGSPEKLKVKGTDGQERPATAADYTNIRWTLTGPVAAGGEGSVSFRAKVK